MIRLLGVVSWGNVNLQPNESVTIENSGYRPILVYESTVKGAQGIIFYEYSANTIAKYTSSNFDSVLSITKGAGYSITITNIHTSLLGVGYKIL